MPDSLPYSFLLSPGGGCQALSLSGTGPFSLSVCPANRSAGCKLKPPRRAGRARASGTTTVQGLLWATTCPTDPGTSSSTPEAGWPPRRRDATKSKLEPQVRAGMGQDAAFPGAPCFLTFPHSSIVKCSLLLSGRARQTPQAPCLDQQSAGKAELWKKNVLSSVWEKCPIVTQGHKNGAQY